MSDEVFGIRTGFQDVAELGQGYLERADGERMLLPLPGELPAGDGVRFIVYLADGTPAFAGAGRCVQVSDQGDHVAEDARYETLIDSLVFDDRSRPVYDYIVAVRQMAYADLGAEAEAAVGDEAVLESEEPTTHTEAASPQLLAATRPSAAQDFDPDQTVAAYTPAVMAAADARATADMRPHPSAAELTPLDHNAGLQFARRAAVAVPEPEAQPEAAAPASRSIIPLPTGILRRPAIAAHWQPKRPKRPQPQPGSGLFRYSAGVLPVPARPPRPELRPDQRVQPAAAPNR